MPELFIGHTRLGTGSSPVINNNNHPFYGRLFHMVHNGVIPSWRDIQKENQLSMNSETDSEVILRVIEKHMLSGKNIINSVEETLDNVWGNMAVALLDKNNPIIWLFRNDNPINVFYVPRKVFGEDVYFFASLKDIFDNAWKTVFKNKFSKDDVEYILLKDNKLYSISPVARDINGVGQKFIVYKTSVKSKFDRSKQYINTTSAHKIYYNQIHYFSDVIDVKRPQLGLKLSDKSIDEIAKKMAEKDGSQKIKIDGLTPHEFASLKTLVDDLFKVETKYFLDKTKNRGEKNAQESYV